MLYFEIFILELSTVNRFSTSASTVSKITSLRRDNVKIDNMGEKNEFFLECISFSCEELWCYVDHLIYNWVWFNDCFEIFVVEKNIFSIISICFQVEIFEKVQWNISNNRNTCRKSEWLHFLDYTWSMNWGMILWKELPWKKRGFPDLPIPWRKEINSTKFGESDFRDLYVYIG